MKSCQPHFVLCAGKMTTLRSIPLAAVAALCLAVLVSHCGALAPPVARVQFNPPGVHVYNVATESATVSWMTPLPSASAKGVMQMAYEWRLTEANITVASSSKIASDVQSIQLPSDRVAMSKTYAFQVRTWLSTDPSSPTPWSRAATFDTVPAGQDFADVADWIGGGGQLRAKAGFQIPPGNVARARLYAAGLGAFYAYVNGERVGDHVMDPPQTVYSKSVQYVAFDVGHLIKEGNNDVGALLGNYKWG